MQVAFDALGMVAGTAVKGKDDSEGDTLNGFKPDLTQDEIDGFYDVSDPHMPAANFLKGATTRVIYDLHRFYRTQQAHPMRSQHNGYQYMRPLWRGKLMSAIHHRRTISRFRLVFPTLMALDERSRARSRLNRGQWLKAVLWSALAG